MALEDLSERQITTFDDHGGERWAVNVVTEGKHQDFSPGQSGGGKGAWDEKDQLGRTVATLRKASEAGVRIPRRMDVQWFWNLIFDALTRADEAAAAAAASQAKSAGGGGH